MNDPPPPRVLSLWFWLSILLAFACVSAGLLIGLYGASLFPVHAASSHALGKLPSQR